MGTDMKYSKNITQYLRQRIGLDRNDSSKDNIFDSYSPSTAFSEVVKWNGLLGSYDETIKAWVYDIYGVDLDSVSARK